MDTNNNSSNSSTDNNNNNDEINFVDTNKNFGNKDSIGYRNLLFRIKTLYKDNIKDEHLAVVPLLHSIKVCPRCIFRFLSIRDMSIYKDEYLTLCHLIQYIIFQHKYSNTKNIEKKENEEKKEEIKEELKEKENKTESSDNTTTTIELPTYDPNLAELKNFVCVCCLGALQDTNNESLFLEEFIKKMKDSGYEFRDYSLALTLPTSTLVRDFSVFYYLCQNFPNLYNTKDNDYFDKVVEIKEGVKWVLGPIIGRRCQYSFKPSSDFRGYMNYIHPETQNDHLFLLDIKNSGGKRQKVSIKKHVKQSDDSTSTVTDLLIKHVTMKDFCANGTVPPKEVQTKYKYELKFEHAPVYLAGKYNKFVRDLPQSPWSFEDNKAIKKSSIEELVTDGLKELFKCEKLSFTSSGREDVDVRMLGRGRSFYIEITDPHKIFFNAQHFKEIEDKINTLSQNSIKVSNLQMITKKETSIIKDSCNTKQKDYRCIVWCSRPMQGQQELDKLINSKKEFTISQQTPVRVLHRRSLMTRPKSIKALKSTFISPHFFTLDVLGAHAGTYIKEFVHGDLGRTFPNIGHFLGCETDILQLDVLNIDFDFPPPRK